MLSRQKFTCVVHLFEDEFDVNPFKRLDYWYCAVEGLGNNNLRTTYVARGKVMFSVVSVLLKGGGGGVGGLVHPSHELLTCPSLDRP